MRGKTPPLNALVHFEALVRCGSVTAAADFLGVTHSAVSKALTLLEDWFGKPLTERRGRRALPTADAIAFAEELSGALDRIARACAALKAGEAVPNELQVLAPTTYAMQWLIPRLALWRDRRKSIPVRLQTTHSTDDWRQFAFDIAIRRDYQPVAGYVATQFLTERLTLVAAPQISSELREGGLKALANVTLLTSTSRPNELDNWLRAAGLVPGRFKARETFGHFYVLLQAALNGLGAAVAPFPVLSEEVMRGHLDVPFPELTLPGVTYSLVVPSEQRERQDIRNFLDWMINESEDSQRQLASFFSRRGERWPPP